MPLTTQAALAVAAALLSALAAVASTATAIIAARLQRRWGSSDAFLRLSDRFESPDFRSHRKVIYNVDRMDFANWPDGQRAAVEAWCGHIDVVSALVLSRQTAIRPLLQLYGDVILRTIYQVAPYCNAQERTRGPQFLLPTRIFTDRLVTLWRAEAAKKRYPLTIGFPALAHVRMNPDLFDSDDELLAFRRRA